MKNKPIFVIDLESNHASIKDSVVPQAFKLF